MAESLHRSKVTQSFGKPILLPEAKRFSDLFEDSFIAWEQNVKVRYNDVRIHGQVVEGHMVTPYCVVSGMDEHYSLYVKARESLIKAIEDNTIALENDYMYFEIVVYKDGSPALVICKYGKIIGDRWLARIDANTIPSMKESA